MRDTRWTTAIAAVGIAVALGVVTWRYGDAWRPAPARPPAQSSSTAVLGSYGQPPAQALPAPPAPRGSGVATLRDGAQGALAAWTQDGKVFVARFAPEAGWTDVRPLEDLAGAASDVRLAGNGHGIAFIVWRHTLGSIDSLRYSRFEPQAGWSAPDVVPGILPRDGGGAPAELEVDAQGRATLRWPSAFAAGAAQVSRFEPGRGWGEPQDVARGR